MNSPTLMRLSRERMAESMAELQGIMTRGATPTDDGKLSVRVVEVIEPRTDEGDGVQRMRDRRKFRRRRQ